MFIVVKIKKVLLFGGDYVIGSSEESNRVR